MHSVDKSHPVVLPRVSTHFLLYMSIWATRLPLDDQFLHAPILVRSIRQEAPDEEGNLLLTQLLHGDDERVRLALERDEDGRIHGDLQCPRPQDSRLFILCHVGRRLSVLLLDRGPLLLPSLGRGGHVRPGRLQHLEIARRVAIRRREAVGASQFFDGVFENVLVVFLLVKVVPFP